MFSRLFAADSQLIVHTLDAGQTRHGVFRQCFVRVFGNCAGQGDDSVLATGFDRIVPKVCFCKHKTFLAEDSMRLSVDAHSDVLVMMMALRAAKSESKPFVFIFIMLLFLIVPINFDASITLRDPAILRDGV